MREVAEALFRRPFGSLHLAWAILIVAVCVVLLTTDRGGHPPPMILVPPVLLAGLLGHLLWLQLVGADPARPDTAVAALVVAGLLGVAIYVLRARRIRSSLG
jgi:hypothetical protein